MSHTSTTMNIVTTPNVTTMRVNCELFKTDREYKKLIVNNIKYTLGSSNIGHSITIEMTGPEPLEIEEDEPVVEEDDAKIEVIENQDENPFISFLKSNITILDEYRDDKDFVQLNALVKEFKTSFCKASERKEYTLNNSLNMIQQELPELYSTFVERYRFMVHGIQKEKKQCFVGVTRL